MFAFICDSMCPSSPQNESHLTRLNDRVNKTIPGCGWCHTFNWLPVNLGEKEVNN